MPAVGLAPRLPAPQFDVAVLRYESRKILFVQCWVTVNWEIPSTGNWPALLRGQLVKDKQFEPIISNMVQLKKEGERLVTMDASESVYPNEDICMRDSCYLQDVKNENTFALTYQVADPTPAHCGTYSCLVFDYLMTHLVRRDVHFGQGISFCM